MTKALNAFSWFMGQVIAAWCCYDLFKTHGFDIAMLVWIAITVLLDIRFKMKGYYE